MQHLIGFTESAAASTETDIDPIQDAVVRINNSHFVFGKDTSLFWAYGASADLDRARITLPSFRNVGLPWIYPLNQAALAISNPNMVDRRSSPLRIPANEEFGILATQTNAGAQQVTFVASIGSRNPTLPSGMVYAIRGTSTTAAATRAWSQVVTTWSDTLPNGRYQIVGLEHVSANGIAARLMLENEIMRPGALSRPLLASRLAEPCALGSQGVLGEFDQNQMPILEVLCNAADAVHTFYLGCVKVG